MSDTDRNSAYDDLLNEIYGPVRLGQFEFSPADIFFELDPIAYRCGLADWEDEYGDEEDDEEWDGQHEGYGSCGNMDCDCN